MVLESLIGPKNAERRPFEMFFLGLVYSSIAMFLSVWIFREQASIIMVLLTVIACMPLVHRMFIYEEKKDCEIEQERTLLKEHGKAILALTFLFLGFVTSFS